MSNNDDGAGSVSSGSSQGSITEMIQSAGSSVKRKLTNVYEGICPMVDDSVGSPPGPKSNVRTNTLFDDIAIRKRPRLNPAWGVSLSSNVNLSARNEARRNRHTISSDEEEMNDQYGHEAPQRSATKKKRKNKKRPNYGLSLDNRKNSWGRKGSDSCKGKSCQNNCWK